MYSRYTPNASGGFDRRQLPDEADLRAAQGRAPPDGGMQNAECKMQNEGSRIGDQGSGGGETDPSTPLRSAQDDRVGAHSVRPWAPQMGGQDDCVGAHTVRPPVPHPHQPQPPPHSPSQPPPGIHPPPPPPILGGLLGPEGLLGQLLPHGLDTEDLLILAILLLSMKQDGASPTELLIAVGLYLWL